MDLGVLLSSGTLAVLVTQGLQYLKRATWFKWLTIETGKLNFAASAVLAIASSAGVHYTWHGGEAGTLVVTGLTMGNFKAFLGHAIAQLSLQHGAYRALVVPGELMGAQTKLLGNISERLGAGPNQPPKVAA